MAARQRADRVGAARAHEDKAGAVRVDVVADLLALVAEDRAGPLLEVAPHEVAQEAVELDARVRRASEAA